MNMSKLGLFSILALALATAAVACDSDTVDTRETTVSLRSVGEDTFELEGDAVDVNPEEQVGGVDWSTVNFNTSAISPLASTGVLADGATASTFTGGRKDIQDISSWSHKDGSVPDKDDITNAYAAAFDVAGDLIIYFGADRFDNSGDAQLAFWFFQNDIEADADGSFSGVHAVGDLLVLVNFEGGGTTPVINVLEWVGTGGNQQGGTLKLLEVSNVECSEADMITTDVCATTNSGPAEAPWAYTPKSGTPGEFPAQTFFEGGINISEMLGDGNVPCFASFMAESRSSTSVTASLKDFVLGKFEVCDLELAYECIEGDVNQSGDGFTFKFGGSVTNTGFGTLFDVTVTSEGQTFDLGELAPGASSPMFMGTFDTLSNQPTTTATATAATTPGGSTITAAPVSDECPLVGTPMIEVTKGCELELEDVGDLIALVVTYEGQVCNETSGVDAVDLENVTVTDDAGTPDDTSDDTIHDIGDLAAGTCKSYEGMYQPASTTSSSPTEAMFMDTVTAFGEATVGIGTATDTASDTCGVCPGS